MSSNRVEHLRSENEQLKAKIREYKLHKTNEDNIDKQISKFIAESEKNLVEMTDKANQDCEVNKSKLHALAKKYQEALKSQLELHNINQELNARKEQQNSEFSQNIEKMTAEYEGKIKEFQKKVKQNVKKIQEVSSSNLMNRLLKNDKFIEQMKVKGVNVQVLQKQSELESISSAVEEKQVEITEMETESQRLDGELAKMRELIETMKNLLESMVSEKENIMKQNIFLKEKMRQSEQLIGKLLGASRDEQ